MEALFGVTLLEVKRQLIQKEREKSHWIETNDSTVKLEEKVSPLFSIKQNKSPSLSFFPWVRLMTFYTLFQKAAVKSCLLHFHKKEIMENQKSPLAIVATVQLEKNPFVVLTHRFRSTTLGCQNRSPLHWNIITLLMHILFFISNRDGNK